MTAPDKPPDTDIDYPHRPAARCNQQRDRSRLCAAKRYIYKQGYGLASPAAMARASTGSAAMAAAHAVATSR